jgi:Domain of unknown function (DUF5666)
MNGTTDHLAIEQLITPAEESMPHLAACAQCAAQAAEWTALGRGVRRLGFDGTAPAGPYEKVLAALDARPVSPRGRLVGLRRTVAARRPVALAGAAAAATVLAAGGYWLSTSLVSGGHPAAGAGHAATLAGVISTGCPGLDLAAGTLDQVNGDDLVLTEGNGTRVTVTTTAGTTIQRDIAGTVSDLADGDQVVVTGRLSGGAMTADNVSVLPGAVLAVGKMGSPAPPGFVTGRVSDVSGGAFEVTESDGTAVSVATTTSTNVTETVSSSVTGLQTGKFTTVAGTEGTDGTLVAKNIQQNDLPPGYQKKVQPSPPSAPGGGMVKVPAPSGKLNGFGCKPQAVTSSYLLSHQS